MLIKPQHLNLPISVLKNFDYNQTREKRKNQNLLMANKKAKNRNHSTIELEKYQNNYIFDKVKPNEPKNTYQTLDSEFVYSENANKVRQHTKSTSGLEPTIFDFT